MIHYNRQQMAGLIEQLVREMKELVESNSFHQWKIVKDEPPDPIKFPNILVRYAFWANHVRSTSLHYSFGSWCDEHNQIYGSIELWDFWLPQNAPQIPPQSLIDEFNKRRLTKIEKIKH